MSDSKGTIHQSSRTRYRLIMRGLMVQKIAAYAADFARQRPGLHSGDDALAEARYRSTGAG